MRQFIKQLRPRNELYTLPIEKVQDFLQEGKQNFLQEGKLTPAEVLKYDSRIDLFIQKLKASNKSLIESKTKLEETTKQLKKELETTQDQFEKIQGRHSVVSNVRQNAFRTIEKVQYVIFI